MIEEVSMWCPMFSFINTYMDMKEKGIRTFKIPIFICPTFVHLLIYLIFLFSINFTLAFVCRSGRQMSSFNEKNVPASSCLSSSSSSLSLGSKIELYSTLGCKHCRKAKSILNKLQVQFTAVDIDEYRDSTNVSSLNPLLYSFIHSPTH